MKKILFLLVLIYNFCFSSTFSTTSSSAYAQLTSSYVYIVSRNVVNSYFGYQINDSYSSFTAPNGVTYRTKAVITPTSIIIYIPVYYTNNETNKPCTIGNLIDFEGGLGICSNGNYNFVPNPDPLGGSQCRDLFQKDGVAYTCNPNTNEATQIPYSNGVTTDPETGDDVPNCNDGYSYTNEIHMTASGGTSSQTGYKSHNCTKNAYNPDGSFTGDNGTTIYPDGSIETPNADGSKTRVYTDGSTTTTYADGTTTSTPPTTPPPTDSGTGTSGGSTGGTDSGSGSTTGGTSGTGSTGGTTGTDTGSGSTGGTDTGTTDTGGTSGTGSTGGMGTDGTGGTTGGGTATGGGGGGTDSGSTTGGTDSGTGGTDSGTTTDGTTGTDTGSGSTGGTDSGTGTTGGTTGTTEPTTGAGDCNDLNMTLTEKTLCKISNIFTPAGTIPTSNPLASSNSLIDGVTSEYSTFKTNIANQGDTLKSLVYSSIDTVNQGFSFNISSNDVVSCPKDYTLDLSALNMANMNVVLDICLQTSKLKPYFYPLFLIMFSVGTTLITFRMLGVLI